MSALPFDEKWQSWQIARNRRGLRTAFAIAVVLYPLFGVLDYLIAPPEALSLLYATRATVTALTLLGIHELRRERIGANVNVVSATYIVLVSSGISLMTVFLGGLSSSYYAGLSLCVVGAGLLFVWPAKVVIPTHATVVASFVIPNLVMGERGDLVTSVSNLFFLVATAIIAGTGQILAFASQREQVKNQVALEAARSEVQTANDALRKLDKFKSEFFANITHELKTPLTMLLAPLELLIDGELGTISKAQRSTFISMQKSGMKLLRLIGDLLELSRLEESRVRLRIEPQDLVLYLRDLVSQTEFLATRKNVALRFDCALQTCIVWCDLERIERVLVNLLSNATKFTHPGGAVVLRLTETSDRVLIEVEDTGVGFPQEEAERVFQRFYQVEMGDTRSQGGTGIGLALAKELVELHGGRISAESTPSVGSTFTVELLKSREHFRPEVLDRRTRAGKRPDGQRTEDKGLGDWRLAGDSRFRLLEIEEVTEQRVVERDTDEQWRSYTVLVVEDTPDVIRMVRLALHHDFRVLAARDGVQGLDLAQRHVPTIIVTDLMMPRMDGLTLTRKLREDPKLKHIPILMLSARNELETRVEGIETGVSAYLAKPFSTKELVSVVRSLVRSVETTTDLVLTQKMDSLETMAGGLAHEIGNPLNYVKNAVLAVQQETNALLSFANERVDKGTPERLDRLYRVVDSGVRRIAGTVDLMIRYSREGFTRAPQEYDLYAALREVLDIVLPTIGHSVDVKLDLTGSGLLVCVPEELNQVLSNLVQNAAEATSPDGSALITIRGVDEGDALSLCVRDNGAGISAENLPRVFGAFFTTKAPGRGMGLGLTIVHRVVRSLGGTITVNSKLGEGTEFLVRLPRSFVSQPASPRSPERLLVEASRPNPEPAASPTQS